MNSIEGNLDKDTDIICVLGCLLTEDGIKIKDEMLKWLKPNFDCIIVNQDPPGKSFEYPALMTAQKLSIIYNKPVLYLHTKGAAHSTNIYNQQKCRLLWKNEFTKEMSFYKEQVKDINAPVVACPFTGNKVHSTYLNGFIATPAAWKKIKLPPPKDRLVYEHLFAYRKDVKVIGRILNNVNSCNLKDNDFLNMAEFINKYEE